MNFLQHFVRAQTQFGLHSPLVYRLYTEVLFARVPREAPRGHGFEAVRWRLERYYATSAQLLPGLPRRASFATADGELLLVDRPHRDEAFWKAVLDDTRFEVTLDLYRCGIAIANPHLSRQHFLLR